VTGSGEVSLGEFLLARLAEDAAAARACAAVYPSPWDVSDRGWVAYVKADAPAFREVARLEQFTVPVGQPPWLGEALKHVARWDPARVLAECEAKRRVVDEYRAVPEGMQQPYRAGLSRALRCLALPYAGHEDFRPEWRL
jgi:hypothetical protein